MLLFCDCACISSFVFKLETEKNKLENLLKSNLNRKLASLQDDIQNMTNQNHKQTLENSQSELERVNGKIEESNGEIKGRVQQPVKCGLFVNIFSLVLMLAMLG